MTPAEVLGAIARAAGAGTFAIIGAVARNAWAPPRATTDVDLLVAKTAFEVEVLRRAVTVDIGGTALPVATPEDLVIYKLIADRPRDRDDIRAVARTQQRAGRTLDWDHVDRWVTYWGLADRLSALREELGE